MSVFIFPKVLSRLSLLLTFFFIKDLVANPAVPELIAHRGASHDAPENTIASLRLAWEQRADAVEVDIRLSSDSHVVLMHDTSTKRTTGMARPVSEQSLTGLRQLDAGSWKDSKWRGEPIPTLQEALAVVPPEKKIFIELKCGPEILPVLGPILKASALKPEQIVLIGFDYKTMDLAKQCFPEYELYWLVSYEKDSRTGKSPDPAQLIEWAVKAGLDGLDLDSRFMIDATLVSRMKSAGLKLYVWTVDDGVLAKVLREAGVNGITTNRPAWLGNFLE